MAEPTELFVAPSVCDEFLQGVCAVRETRRHVKRRLVDDEASFDVAQTALAHMLVAESRQPSFCYLCASTTTPGVGARARHLPTAMMQFVRLAIRSASLDVICRVLASLFETMRPHLGLAREASFTAEQARAHITEHTKDTKIAPCVRYDMAMGLAKRAATCTFTTITENRETANGEVRPVERSVLNDKAAATCLAALKLAGAITAEMEHGAREARATAGKHVADLAKQLV